MNQEKFVSRYGDLDFLNELVAPAVTTLVDGYDVVVRARSEQQTIWPILRAMQSVAFDLCLDPLDEYLMRILLRGGIAAHGSTPRPLRHIVVHGALGTYEESLSTLWTFVADAISAMKNTIQSNVVRLGGG
jgi:hypothetical protein